MNLSNDLLEKAKMAKTAAELAGMAKAAGIGMTAEEAANAFAKLHATGELADDELDNVSGGCGGDDNPSPDGRQKSRAAVTFLYKVGQEVTVIGWTTSVAIVEKQLVIETMGGYYPYYKVRYKSSGSLGTVQQGHIQKP